MTTERHGRLGYDEPTTRAYAALDVPEPPVLEASEVVRGTTAHPGLLPALIILTCRDDVDRWDGAPVDGAPEVGARYRDRISGWTGVANTVSHHLDGTWTAEIVGENGADGPIAHWINAARLDTVPDETIGFRPS